MTGNEGVRSMQGYIYQVKQAQSGCTLGAVLTLRREARQFEVAMGTALGLF